MRNIPRLFAFSQGTLILNAQASDYLPIDLVSAIRKVIEIIYSEILRDLDNHNLIHSGQYGFR